MNNDNKYAHSRCKPEHRYYFLLFSKGYIIYIDIRVPGVGAGVTDLARVPDTCAPVNQQFVNLVFPNVCRHGNW